MEIKQKALTFLDCEINEPNIRECLAFMTEHQITINSPEGTVDICGTGGTGLSLLNISTATAIVVAACGYPVAKHCGGGVTSKCGSSDVLRALGVNMDITPEQAEKQLADLGLVFLNARIFNPVFDMIAEERKAKGFSIYNVMGALISPANADYKITRVLDGIDSAMIENILIDDFMGAICDNYDFGTGEHLIGGDADYNSEFLIEALSADPMGRVAAFAYKTEINREVLATLCTITSLPDNVIMEKTQSAYNNGKALELLNKVINYGKGK